MPEYISYDDVYGPDFITLDEAYGGLDPWETRIQDVREDAQRRVTDPEAEAEYLKKRWANDAEAYIRGTTLPEGSPMLADLNSPVGTTQRTLARTRALEIYQKELQPNEEDRLTITRELERERERQRLELLKQNPDEQQPLMPPITERDIDERIAQEKVKYSPKEVLRLPGDTPETLARLEKLGNPSVTATRRIEQGYRDEFRQQGGALQQATDKFIELRGQLGTALMHQHLLKNPWTSEKEAREYAHIELLKHGYDPEDENLLSMLPELDYKPPLESFSLAAVKATGQNLWRGSLELLNLPIRAALAAGEITTDLMKYHPELLPFAIHSPVGQLRRGDPPDLYRGWYKPLNSPDPIRKEERNYYREMRERNSQWLDKYAPVPSDPRLGIQIIGGVARAIPQLAAMATSAAAARGATLAGNVAKASSARWGMMATMFTMEGDNAFSQWMEDAKAKGLNPGKASLTAAGGAFVYAGIATTLERFGPFAALEKYVPNCTNRMIAAIIVGGAEGGTELLQGFIQEGGRYGLKFRDVTYENLRESVLQVVMGGLIGFLAGGGVGAITFTPTEIKVRDPGALDQKTLEILTQMEQAREQRPTKERIQIEIDRINQAERQGELAPEQAQEQRAELEAAASASPTVATKVSETFRAQEERDTFGDTVREQTDFGTPPVTPTELPPVTDAPARAKAVSSLQAMSEADLQTVASLDTAEYQAWDAAQKAAGEADISAFTSSLVSRYTAALARGDTDTATAVRADLRTAAEQRAFPIEKLVKDGQTQAEADATMNRWATEELPRLVYAEELLSGLDDSHKTRPIGKPDYRPSDRPTQTELKTIRDTMRNRKYASDRVVHVTSLDSLDGIASQGIQPSTSADGGVEVWGSRTDSEGTITGAAASYGRGGVPVLMVLSPRVQTPGTSLGDTTVRSPGKSYVAAEDIEAVYVGTDAEPYSLDAARNVYSEDVINFKEQAAALEDAPATDSMADAAAVEGVPDGVPAKTLLEGLQALLSDESGALPVDGMGKALTGGIAGAAEEVGLLGGGVHATILDESAPLRQSPAGRAALALIDEADSHRRRIYASHLQTFDQSLLQLPVRRRSRIKLWMRAYRDDGTTNWSTLIEHPERVQDIPPDVAAALAAYQDMQERTGVMAENVKIPQMQRRTTPEGKTTWVTAPFQRAKSGKYFRMYTQDGIDMFVYQDGHYLWDALVTWFMKYPERNPRLDTSDPTKLRNQLQGLRQSGGTKKAGSLEFVRIFKELPVALIGPDGKWVPILLNDPRAHFSAALQQQAQRIAYWGAAQEMLLPHYGKLNEKTGKVEYRQPTMHKDLTDVDGLTDRLRKDVTSQAKKGKNSQAARSFNRALDNFQRSHHGGYAEEYLISLDLLGKTKAAQTAKAVDRAVTASVLQMSPMFDITNPLRTATEVGVWGMLKGRLLSAYDIFRSMRGGIPGLGHSKAWDSTAAYYVGIGAVIDGHAEWAAHRESWFKDVFHRDVPQFLMSLGRWTEQRSQYTIAKTFDLWVQELNKRKNVSSFNARRLQKHLRLTNDQVLEISRGAMSHGTRAKVIQNGVNLIAGLTESAHRKGAIQNWPLGRWAFRYLSVVNAVTRHSALLISDLQEDMTTVLRPGATAGQRKQAASMAAQTGWSILSQVVAIAGSGFLSSYLRRAAYHRPLVEPEDPETWMGALGEALLEGGIFGPYYRFFEAGKYSNWRLSEMPTKLIFPLGVMAEAGSALMGLGRYEGSEWDRRLDMLGVKFSPAYKAAKGWFASQTAPSREKYTFTHKMVRKFNKDRGVEPPYVQGKRNWKYYEVFEAVRDGNQAAVDEALEGYRTWATDQGWDAEKARKGLAQSLNSRRPINLNKEAAKEFLAGLPAIRRTLAEQENERYKALVDRITRKPPGYLGGNWYGAK